MGILPVVLPPAFVADPSRWTSTHQRAWELVRQWEQAAQPYRPKYRLWDFVAKDHSARQTLRDPNGVMVFKQVFLRLDTYAATLNTSSEELIAAFWSVFGPKPHFVVKLRPNWMLNADRAGKVLASWRDDLAQRGLTSPAREEEVRGYIIASATAPLRDRARASVKYGYDRAADMVWMGKLQEKFRDEWFTLRPSPDGDCYEKVRHPRRWFDGLLGMLWLDGPYFGKEWLWGLGPVWRVPPEVEQAARESYEKAESLAGKDADPVRYWGRSVLVEWHEEFVGVIERSINHRMPVSQGILNEIETRRCQHMAAETPSS